MASDHPIHPRGLLPVMAAVATLLILVLWLSRVAWHSATDGGPLDFSRLLDLTLAGVGAPVALWLAIAVISSSCRVLRGLPRARFTPALVHRLVALALGAALAGAPMTANAAPVITATSITTVDPSWAGHSEASANRVDPGSVPVPGWTPSTATLPPPRADPADPAVVGSPRPSETSDTVVVHRGDTLWAIAARQLGPDATAVEIAAAWPKWWDANRDVIGGNPDLILPGQQLRIPAT